ncbi:MAG: hypothetical protein ACI4RC_02525 [Oscillospiraceae bacterium]
MENDFEMNDELLEKVNKYTRKPLTADEIFAFPLILCDNDIDRDFDCFSIDALYKLAELFLGKTGIFDHDPKGENQTARIFDTEVKTDNSKLTQYGTPYVYLCAKAYMVKTSKNADLIAEINGGIKKEVSVSCSVKNQTCSICGEDIKVSPCSHVKGGEYDGKLCYVTLDEPRDAYEWSFVAVPAQRNAGVTKKFGKNDSKTLQAENARLKSENAFARDMVKKEILRLSFLCNPVLSVKTVSELTKPMDMFSLCRLKDSLEKDLQKHSQNIQKTDNFNEQKKHNNNFKIN